MDKSFQENIRLDFLDFLRGIAVIMVFLSHALPVYNYSIFNSLENLFSRGVQLFYLVSGFTIFFIYYGKINSRKDFIIFMVKRFFRIMPLLYILIPIYYFTFGLKLNYFSTLPDWYHVLSHYCLLFGFHPDTMASIMGHAWSIFDEFIFYIFFGAIALNFYKVNIYIYLFVFLLIVSILTFLAYNTLEITHSMKVYLALSPLIQIYIFFMGGLIFLMSKKYFIHKYAFIVTLIILIMYSFILKSSTLSIYFVSILFCIILLYLSQQPKIHFNKTILFIGKISFSIYLTHIYILLFFEKYNFFDNHTTIFVVLSFIVTIILSITTYKYIEQPFINLGKKLIYADSKNAV